MAAKDKYVRDVRSGVYHMTAAFHRVMAVVETGDALGWQTSDFSGLTGGDLTPEEFSAALDVLRGLKTQFGQASAVLAKLLP